MKKFEEQIEALGKVKKYYVVRVGTQPGVYGDWASCQQQVKGVSGAEFKSFKTKEEALEYLAAGLSAKKPMTAKETEETAKELSQEEGAVVIYTDGSSKQEEVLENSLYSYGFVAIVNNQEIHKEGALSSNMKASSSLNVAGELLGAMKATIFAINKGFKKVYIFHDFKGVADFVTGEWSPSKENSREYKDYMKMLSEKIEIEFVKVPAHSGDKWNEMADQLAYDAIYKS